VGHDFPQTVFKGKAIKAGTAIVSRVSLMPTQEVFLTLLLLHAGFPRLRAAPLMLR
jgi:hypothetical protein